MKIIILLICLTSASVSFGKMTYQLLFPKSDKFPHAKLVGTIDHSLEEYTFCHWDRYVGDTPGTVLSYCSAQVGTILLTRTFNDGQYWFRHSGLTSTGINTKANPLQWRHICTTATTFQRGNWSVYVDGAAVWTGKENKTETPLRPNGWIVLGQYCQSNEQNFYAGNGFRGQIADVFMWDRILTPGEIAAVYKCTNTEDANVINWNLHTWELNNGARISLVDLPCGKT